VSELKGRLKAAPTNVTYEEAQTSMTDIRYATRLLLKNPGFTAIAVLTLALGIGATTAIFSGVDAVLLRPLPFPEPERLVFVWETLGRGRGGVTAPDFRDWRRDQRVFERLAVYAPTTIALTEGNETERVPARRVSADYFRVLGIRPTMGRDFIAADEPFGAPRTVIVSDAIWRGRFRADPAIVNQEVLLNGVRHTIIGVLPPGVALFERAEQVYVPLALTPAEIESTGSHFLTAIARLGPGLSIAQAQAGMAPIAARLAQVRPHSNREVSVLVTDMHATLVGNLRTPLLVFLGAVALVLLIACANIANLQLVRATGRQREVAIRGALGAGRRRILQQFLIESLVLAAFGGAAGVLVASWSSELVAWLIPSAVPRLTGSAIDLRVLTFAAVATLATGVIFGLAPAWQLSRRDLRERLNDGGRGSAGPERHRVSASLVVIEIALALTLLIGAGLLARSFLRLLAEEPGLRTQGVLTLRVSLPEVRYRESARVDSFYVTILERVRALPGVTSAGATSTLPLRSSGSSLVAPIDGRPKPTRIAEFPVFFYRGITPGYFQTLGIPILEGRDLSSDDREGRPRVAILNQTAARRYWPNGRAIGARLHPDDDGGPAEVIGVVADTKHFGLAEATAPEMFIAISQAPPPFWRWMDRSMDLVVHMTGAPTQAVAPIRAVVAAVDPALPVYQVTTMEGVLSESMVSPRRSMLMVSAFGAIALLLAAIGLYGVMAFLVSQRTHEIGVRVALGAAHRDILALVFGRSVRLCVIGLVLGLVAALGLSRFIATFLFRVTATDVVTYGVVSALLFAVALLASYVPARRAMRVDPVRALREE
jgi:putative ABC transport system permease protein